MDSDVMAARFTPGQQVFVVWFGRRGNTSFETIEKVGRKWATLKLYGSRYRFDVDSMFIDSGGIGSSPGCIYLSEGDYLEEKARNELWRQLRDALHSHQTTKVTADQIRAAAKALGITLSEQGKE